MVPTNRDMIRDDFADLVFRNQSGKWNAVIDEIAEEHEKGRPVLVGTISVAVSEMLGDMLKRRGINSVLNAKFHEKEAEIVAQAGRSGAVTIATNMAGRGTDILLGGNPEVMAAELLHKAAPTCSRRRRSSTRPPWPRPTRSARRTAIGSLLPAACTSWAPNDTRRRIDNQLRGRAGRQGDPGSSRFYLSLEDDLMRRFASDRVSNIMGRLGFDDETALESGMVSRTIEGAQTRVRATTSTPASTSCSTTTSSTASARRSITSANGSCARRTCRQPS